MRRTGKQNDTLKEILIEFMMAFFVCTACICILEGILGIFFMPQQRFGYEAFFSPPLFGFFSVLFGLVTRSKKEMSMAGVLVRQVIHLALIELLVFGLNDMAGNQFETALNIALACSIAVIFVMVNVVLYINDRRSAMQFNEQLKQFQEKKESERKLS